MGFAKPLATILLTMNKPQPILRGNWQIR